MANKQINARVALKHDIEENWITAGDNGFCPLAGEVIIYDIQEGVCSQLRYKIGRKDSNGHLININDLPFETNLHVGTIEPIDAPVGFMWLDTSDEVELITFSLDIYDADAWWDNSITETKEYVAEKGMTFKDWVKSAYNTDHWACMGYSAINGDPQPEANEEDHKFGAGRVLYTDGSYGNQEMPDDGRTLEYVEWLVARWIYPTWDVTVEDNELLDCETIITDNSHYWVMRYKEV